MNACRCGWQVPRARVGFEATIGGIEPSCVLVTLQCPTCAALHFTTLREVDAHGRYIGETPRSEYAAACGVVTHGTACLFIVGHDGPHMFKATHTGGESSGNDDDKKGGG